MNIPPDNPPDSNVRPKQLNDLNRTRTAYSIDDNTVETLYEDNLTAAVRPQRKRKERRLSLSVYEKELEEARQLLEANIERHVFEDNLVNSHSPKNTSKEVNICDGCTNYRHRQSENVYRQFVQAGNRNLMLITEPLESKSDVYLKQIGDRNMLMNLKVSSNVCQLLDPMNNRIIMLDNKGQVWLEIKFPDRKSTEISDSSSDSIRKKDPEEHSYRSSSDIDRRFWRSVSENTDSFLSEQGATANSNMTHRRSISSAADSLLRDLDVKFSEHSRPACSQHNVPFDSGSRRAVENSYYDDSDFERQEDHYTTISVQEKHNSLIIKFEKNDQNCCLDRDNIINSPILRHQKVIEFLTNQGNCFDVPECDVSICDWEYETESVYSYISNFRVATLDDYEYARVGDLENRNIGIHTAPSFGFDIIHEEDPLEYTDKNFHRSEGRTNDSAIKGYPNPPAVPPRPQISEPERTGRRLPPPPPPTLERHNINKARETPRRHLQNAPQSSKIGGHTVQLPKAPPPPLPDYLLRFSWYHGDIQKAEVKRRLHGKPHGSFLVRRARGEEPSHKYTIELMDNGNLKKLMVMKTGGKYHFKDFEKQQAFDNVEDLINTLERSGLEVKETSTGLWKTIPVTAVPK